MERLADELDLAQLRVEAETNALVAAVVDQVYAGRGCRHCTDCGAAIPEARRQRVPNAQRCVGCQERFEWQARFRNPAAVRRCEADG